LRTLDALHLAIALRESLALATADRGLADAAKKLGMKVMFVR
jgi:predicted nucleic acid-binding protein